MNHRFITHHNNSRLIILFLGWGMDCRPFLTLAVEGYDLLLCWDYSSLDFDTSELEGYEEIVVIAWSFGVPAATSFIINNPQLPITGRIAVNGTQHPIDDNLGIPHTIFAGTLSGMSEENLMRFYRRMTGSSAAFKKFFANIPEREISSLITELTEISLRNISPIKWDIAYVSDSDRIIPTENQLRAWSEEALSIRQIEGSHYPDFQSIISESLADKQLIARRFSNAATTYASNAHAQSLISARLIDLWKPEDNKVSEMIEIGCGAGTATKQYLSRISPSRLELWDLFPAPSLPEDAIKVKCDAETRLINTPSESVDVIFTSSTVQWFNSLPAFFRNVCRILRHGGKLVMSTFSTENFSKLRQFTDHQPQYFTFKQILGMVPDEMEVIDAVTEQILLDFPSPEAMLRHIIDTGVNALQRNPSPAIARSILNDYPRNGDGSVTLDYSPIYLILRKK